MVRGIRGGNGLNTHIGDDRWNMATVRKIVFGMLTGERSFDDFDRGSGSAVFRTQGDDSPATMEDIADELKGGGAHEAMGVEAQSDVVNPLAAMHRFRNHELFVFGPFEARGNLRLGRRLRDGGRRGIAQVANHGVERVHGRGLHPALIGGKNRLKTVGGGENYFGQLRAARLGDLRGEYILELMSQFAQFVKAT